jgi:hypothetical protein
MPPCVLTHEKVKKHLGFLQEAVLKKLHTHRMVVFFYPNAILPIPLNYKNCLINNVTAIGNKRLRPLY